MRPEDQVIRYADIGGRSLAWSSVGSGPTLVVGGWWSSHLQLDWADVGFRDFVARLAAHRTVVRYDRLGTGLSDRNGPIQNTLEEELDTLTRFVEVLGEPRVSLLGASSGGPVVGTFAARNPGLVDRLVMYGSYADGASIASPAARDSLLAVVNDHWGLGSRVLADMFLPEASAEERAAYATFQRESATREMAIASLRTVFDLDASEDLARIAAPTLVIHRRDDRAIPFPLGRDLANRIPFAEFCELDGINHLPWRGDSQAVTDAILRFLGVAVESATVVPGKGAQLSPREIAVLQLVAQGNTDQQIAARLSLSPHTVHRHIANIRAKLGVTTRAAAAAWATHHGVV